MGNLGDVKAAQKVQSKHIILKEEKPKNQGGRPSFKQGLLGEDWKARKIEITEKQLKQLAMLKINSDIEGLDHAIHTALDTLFKKYKL